MAGPNTNNFDLVFHFTSLIKAQELNNILRQFVSIFQALIPIANSNSFSGTSVNVINQFTQNNLAGEVFQAYDYGFIRNRKIYGTFRPYKYDLKKVTVPVIFKLLITLVY